MSNKVILNTNFGDIALELDSKKAPVTVENFKKYVEEGHYDGTIFHRVIKNFMIQGGGLDADFNEKKTREPIINEATNGLSNKVGTIAMARTQDPDSATAQFFINVVDNNFLDADKAQDGFGYAVFGKVISGMEVVEKIKEVKTGTKSYYRDVPQENIIIESAKILEEEREAES